MSVPESTILGREEIEEYTHFRKKGEARIIIRN